MHCIALASGVVPELAPVDTVLAAATGGFDAVGLWVEPASWRPSDTATVRSRLDDTGLRVIDVEVIWIKPGPLDPDHLRILDIGLDVGAANALVVSSDPDMGATAAKFADLCAHIETSDLRVALEFGLFTDVTSLGMASDVLRRVGNPSAALLIDALHLDRSGGTMAQVAQLPREWLSYAQLCDAPAKGPDRSDAAGILDEAVHGRLQTGEGGLDLPALLDSLPADIPLSIELRSRALCDAYPNAGERAKATALATRRFLASIAS